MNSVSAEVANLAIDEALRFCSAEIAGLRAELACAKFAGECHLRTVQAQQKIIQGQNEQIAQLKQGK